MYKILILLCTLTLTACLDKTVAVGDGNDNGEVSKYTLKWHYGEGKIAGCEESDKCLTKVICSINDDPARRVGVLESTITSHIVDQKLVCNDKVKCTVYVQDKATGFKGDPALVEGAMECLASNVYDLSLSIGSDV